MKLKASFFFVLAVQLIAVVLMLEASLRIWYFVKGKITPPFSVIVKDLGWRPNANIKLSYARRGYGDIDFSSLDDGFRTYGDPQSTGLKLFAVGDSFTHAYHVSDGKPYYSQLTNHLPQLEIFAFGAGGYGTLQEAMILNRYLADSNASVVVWQFTGNDFINNDWLLESRSHENSSHMRRPFWRDGEIVYLHPDGLFGLVAEYSLLARRLLVIRGSIQKRKSGSVEDRLDIQHPDLQRSIETTRQILADTIAQFPAVRFTAFFAGSEHYPWELQAFTEVCELQQLTCFPAVHRRLSEEKLNGGIIDGGADGHWNAAGHALAAKVLADELAGAIKLPANSREPGN